MSSKVAAVEDATGAAAAAALAAAEAGGEESDLCRPLIIAVALIFGKGLLEEAAIGEDADEDGAAVAGLVTGCRSDSLMDENEEELARRGRVAAATAATVSTAWLAIEAAVTGSCWCWCS